jgi:hypothetical protein
MPSVFERLENREAFPVEGTHLFVREPLIDEITRATAVRVELQQALLFAFAIVNKDGEPLMTQGTEETDEQFAERSFVNVNGMRGSTFKAVKVAITELLNPVHPDELAKN